MKQPHAKGVTKRADTIISDYVGPRNDLISPLASSLAQNPSSQRKEKSKFKKAAPYPGS